MNLKLCYKIFHGNIYRQKFKIDFVKLLGIL